MFDRALIQKCQKNAPRYTSYPTADRFSSAFDSKLQLTQLQSLQQKNTQPISLYIHIPFCNTLCLFCGCNKIITNDKTNISRYLNYLEREIQTYHAIIGKRLDVMQLHFGGGSPSWMSLEDLARVMAMIKQYFNLDHAREIAMEVDPRHTTTNFIESLHQHGFNRLSLGVQDLDATVQKAINRIQPLTQNMQVLAAANTFNFKSTNIDLIYGLPFQSMKSFEVTIDHVTNLMHPARIALFNYAHIPSLFMPQTRINEDDLPKDAEKLDMLQMSVAKLIAAGYVFIGMDHFALPTDELAIALKNGTLQRNFQGYSTFADTNMLAFGVSAIGFIGDSYYQNTKDLNEYYKLVDAGALPIMRGVKLNDDDLLRRQIIQDIMCQFALDFTKTSNTFNIDFAQYFAAELGRLLELQQLELITLTANGFQVTPRGRFLIRNVAMVFDKYLTDTKHTRHSKTI